MGARRYIFYLAPKFSMMSVLSLTEPLRQANEISGQQLYNYHFVSNAVTCDAVNGMSVATETELPLDHKLAGVIVCASYQYDKAYNEKLGHWLRWLDRHSVQIGVTDAGIFPAARSGISWTEPMCVHWLSRPALRELYPQRTISERLYEYAPNRFSCAGATAGLDLMQHIIGLHHGDGFAARVASHLMFGGGVTRERTAQSPLADYASLTTDQQVRRVLQLMEQTSGHRQNIPAMAESVGLSQSQLNRRFKRLFGQTVAHVYQACRLRRAHSLLKSCNLSVEVIAFECGFSSRSQFTSAFKSEFGEPPSAVRGGWN
ncbi:GlxA family transcriptional regulator [Ostreiculturibacter nitratireducens]|uniref:GlxA family transcriptional regulator n=1 Tax=Ostreiculturibacter nitratireducens TaxID=3075226 RepID=UPI0031B62AC1